MVALVSVPGFFGSSTRDAVVVAGFLLLLWLPGVHAPRLLNQVVAAVAGASLFIYLTHWQVYPHLYVDHPLLAAVASVLVGLAVERCARTLTRRLTRLESRRAANAGMAEART